MKTPVSQKSLSARPKSIRSGQPAKNIQPDFNALAFEKLDKLIG